MQTPEIRVTACGATKQLVTFRESYRLEIISARGLARETLISSSACQARLWF